MPLISHKKDPAGIEQTLTYHVVNGTNVIDWIVRNYESQDDLCGELACSFILNGKEIFRTDHENKDESLLDIELRANDSLIIVNRPAGLEPLTWLYIAIAVVAVGISVYSYMSMPSLGSQEGASESPNSKLNAGSNEFRPYEGVPEIFGTGVAYPDFIQPSYYFYENNIKKVVGLLCLTAGEADIHSVNIGATDIESIADSSATVIEPGDQIDESFLIINTTSTEIDGQTLLAPDDEGVSETEQEIEVGTIDSGTYAGYVFIDVDDSDYSDGTFLYNVNLDVGDYLYIRSGTLYNKDDEDDVNYVTLNGVFEILAIESTSSPARIVIDLVRNYDATYTNEKLIKIPLIIEPEAQVGRGYSEGVIGEGTNGELDIYVGWYELAGSETEEVWVNWTMPYGLRKASGGKAYVSMRFDIQEINGEGEYTGNIWSKTEELTKSTADGQYNTLKFTKDNTSGMPTSKFAFRAVRLSDSVDRNGSALETIKLETVSSVVPYTDYDFSDVTVLLVQRKATLFSSDQSGKKINVEYTRRLPEYNRETGEYDVNNLVGTNSFADAAAYTLIVAGDETTETVNMDELYGIYDGLDDPDLGEFSYTFDDADLSKGERVDNICKAARVISFHDGNRWRFNRDEIKPTKSALFNRRSTVGNQSKQSWQPQRGDDSDSVRIIYVDPDFNTEAYVDRVFDSEMGDIVNDEIGVSLKEITLAGCRNITQATNRADLEIRRLAYQRRGVTETTYRDALSIDLLDRVGWVDVNDIETFDGEIMGIDGNDYDTTERFTPKDGVEYVVFVTDAEGYPSNTVVCTPRDDTEFGFSAIGISDAYVASGDQQVGSRYFIATTEDLESSSFTLTSRTPSNDGTVDVELAEYRPEMYEKDGSAAAKDSPQVPVGLTASGFAPSGSISSSILMFESNGKIDLNGIETSWYSGGIVDEIGGNFEIYAELVSGSASGLLNQWLSMSDDLSWSLSESEEGETESAVVNFKVRQVEYTSSVASNNITIKATVGSGVELPELITVSESGVNQVITAINFNYDGTYSGSDGSSGTYTTVSDGIGGFYEIKATSVMQADFPMSSNTIMGSLDSYVNGNEFDEWHMLNASGASWDSSTSSNTSDATFYATIRRISDNSDVGTCIITLNANIE